MLKTNLALSDVFDEAEHRGFSATYRKFLKAPAEGLYALEEKITVKDHNNGLGTDVPFHDGKLVPVINQFLKRLNATQEKADQVYLYIPAHRKPSDREFSVFSNNETLLSQVKLALETILSHYQNDDLDFINAKNLAEDTAKKTKTIGFRKIFALTNTALPPAELSRLSPEELKDRYLQGADIAPPKVLLNENLGVSRVEFKIPIETFDGQRLKSYRRLTNFLKEKVDVAQWVSPCGFFQHFEGPKDQNDIAYRMTTRAAPAINAGKKLDQVWIENFYADAKLAVGKEKAFEQIGLGKVKASKIASFDPK